MDGYTFLEMARRDVRGGYKRVFIDFIDRVFEISWIWKVNCILWYRC